MARSPNIPNPNAPNDVRSIQALVRFSLRMIVLCVFATLGTLGFGRSMIALLWLSTILCAVAGVLRRGVAIRFGSHPLG